MSRKYLIILLISLVAISTLSAVSAEDLNTTDTMAIEDSQDSINENVLSSTHTVSGNTFADIQNAVDSAKDGDTIFLSGKYTGKGTQIKIEKTLTIEGNGATLDADSKSRIFEITGKSVTVNNITFINGQTTGGSAGAIDWWSGNKNTAGDTCGVLTNCRFIDCHAEYWGGALYYSNNKLTMTNCYFEDNSANYGAALKLNGADCVVANCEFVKNTARNDGGGIHCDEETDAVITNCTFKSNNARNGGAIYSKNKNAVISKSSFSNNFATNGNNYYGEAKSSIAISSCSWDEGNINDYSTLGLAGEYAAVNLIRTSIAVPEVSGIVNSDQIITATVRDASNNPVNRGQVQFKINGKTLNAYVKDGKASITFKLTTVGSVTATAQYIYGGTYDSSSNNFKITGERNYVKFTASALSTYYNSGEKFNVKVLSKDGAQAIKDVKVLVKVYTGSSYKTYTQTSNANGIASFNIPNLGIGNHKVEINTADSKSTVADPISSSIKITQLSATLAPVKLSTTYGSGKYFQVKVVNSKTKKVAPGVKLTLRIYTGSSYKTVTVTSASNGYAKYDASLLSVGTHKIVVSAKESKYVAASAKTSSVKVAKATLTISAPQVTNEYQKSQAFKVTVKNKQTGKGMNGINVNIKVYTGPNYKTYTVKTDANGVATFNTKSLSKTAHNVVVSVGKTAKYNAASAKSKITIIKVKLATTITIESCYKTSNIAEYYIKASIKDSKGHPVVNRDVTIETIITLGSLQNPTYTSGTTDANGVVEGYINVGLGGITEYDITVIFDGDDSYQASRSQTRHLG